MERAKIRIAYVGSAVEDGTMNLNELSAALLALSNLVGSANRVLNADNSTVEVRLSADVERGSFEMTLEIVRTLADQIKLLFTGTDSSLIEILGAIGLVSTLSGVNLIEIFRWVKGRRIDSVEKIDNGNSVRVTIGDESKEISIGTWKIFSSHKTNQHIEGVLHPLKTEGVTGFEVRDFSTRQAIEKISSDEVDYFKPYPLDETTKSATQEIVLKIISVSFEPNLKWRFDDGDTKFYALVTDQKFLKQVEEGLLAFSKGDLIVAKVETKQRYSQDGLTKTEKIVVEVLKILRHLN